VKNDELDTAEPAYPLRLGWLSDVLPGKLVGMCASCKNQVHVVLGKLGIPVTFSDQFGVDAIPCLDILEELREFDRLGSVFAACVEALQGFAELRPS
jgi:Fe-S oxidoreductase